MNDRLRATLAALADEWSKPSTAYMDGADRAASAIGRKECAAELRSALAAEPEPAGGVGEAVRPFAWVIPGDDNADVNGYLSARVDREGEFTAPLYAIPAGYVLVPRECSPEMWSAFMRVFWDTRRSHELSGSCPASYTGIKEGYAAMLEASPSPAAARDGGVECVWRKGRFEDQWYTGCGGWNGKLRDVCACGKPVREAAP